MSVESTKLAAQLRERHPARIVVEDADGEERKIALPKRGHRYEAAAEAILGWDWRRVLLYNPEGEILGAPIVRVEEAPPADDAHPMIQDTAEGRAVALVIQGQNAVMAHHRAIVDPVVEGYKRTIEMLSEQLQAMVLQRERDVRMLEAMTNRMLADRVALAEESTGDPMERQVMGALLQRVVGGRRGVPDADLPPGSPS